MDINNMKRDSRTTLKSSQHSNGNLGTSLNLWVVLTMILFSSLSALAQAPDEIIVKPPPGVRAPVERRFSPSPPIIRKKINPPRELISQFMRDARAVADMSKDEADEVEKGIFAEAIDLNNDGKPEFFVGTSYLRKTQLSDTAYCIADYCPISIYRKTAKGYELMLRDQDPEPQKVFTNGYRNIAAVLNTTALFITLYKFDGKKYKAAACYERDFIDGTVSRSGKTTRVKCDDLHPN